MSKISDLMVRILGDASGFSEEMRKVNYELLAADKKLNSSTEGFARFGGRMTSIGAGLSAAITLPVVGLATAAVSAASDFESAMNKVSAVGDITGQNLRDLDALAMQLGKETKFSAREAAEGMGELAASGFNASQITAAMPGVLSLAAAGQLSVASASEIASNAMNGFQIPAKRVGHVADVVAKAAASGSLNVQDFGLSMKYIAPVASAAGVSFEEAAAAVTIMSNAGVKGEQAGTSLRGALASLLAPSNEVQETLDRLGIVTTDAGGKLLPFAQIIEQLKAKAAGAPEIFRIFGRESASGIQALVNAGAPALRTLTNDLEQSDGAAKKMAETMNSGIKGAMEKFRGSVETAGIALGKVLQPYVIAAVGALETGANATVELIGIFRELPVPVQAVAIALVGLTAAAGPAIYVGGNLALAFRAIAGAATTASVAVTAFTASLNGGALAGILSKLGAIGLALGGLYGAWKLFENDLKKPWQRDDANSLAGVNKEIRGLITSIQPGAENARLLGEEMARLAKKATKLPPPLKILGDQLKKAKTDHKEHREEVQRHADAVERLYRASRELAGIDWKSVATAPVPPEVLAQTLPEIGTRDPMIFDRGVGDPLGGAANTKRIEKILDGVKPKLGGINETLRQMKEEWRAAWKTGGSALADLVLKGGKFKDVVIQLGENLGKALINAPLQAAMSKLGELLESIAKKVIQLAVDHLPGLGSALGKVFGSATSSAGSAAGGAVSAAGGAAGSIAGVASGITGVVGAVGAAVSAVTGVIGLLQNARLEGTMNQVERNTAAASIHLLHTLNKANEFWPWMKFSHDRLAQIIQNGLGVYNYADTALRVSGGGAATVNVTGNFIGFRDLDELVDEIAKRLKARGV